MWMHTEPTKMKGRLWTFRRDLLLSHLSVACVLPRGRGVVCVLTQGCSRFDTHRVVEFASRSDLKNAISKLDGTDLNGRKLKIFEDRRRR